ncbi:hypothetical protein ACRRRS_21790 (plasmid) [Brucella anthropi]|uniref:hypothetical protein n=1 Tax=Brucella anthropi TaxID=529 RepID=UPI003D7DE715
MSGSNDGARAYYPLEFRPASQLPNILSGAMTTLIVLYRTETGREVVLPAYYLNSYPLYMDDACTCAEEHSDDGCPCTGWYQQVYHPDYDDAYAPLRCEVIAWASLPTADAVKALIPAPECSAC